MCFGGTSVLVRNGGKEQETLAYGTMFSAIRAANFPTLVPPYFCTTHLALGSIVF